MLKEQEITHATGQLCAAYVINLTSGHVYVGSTSNMYFRKSDHESKLKNDKHPNAQLQKLYNSGEKISWKVHITETRERAEELEQRYMDEHRPSGFLLNVLPEAGKTRGVQRGDEFRKKVSLARTSKRTVKELKTPDPSKKFYREHMQAINAARSKPVEIDGVVYESSAAAARSLGYSKTMVGLRIKNPQFPTWKFVDGIS